MDDVTELYSWYAEFYVSVYGWRSKSLVGRWQDLAPLLRAHSETTTLDVGCGVGRDSFELARHGFDIAGVEISPQMIAVGRNKAEEEGLPVTFLVGNATDLGTVVGDRLFDAAVCVGDSILHSTGPDELLLWLRSMSAVLAPGGILLLQCQLVEPIDSAQSEPKLGILKVLREGGRTEVYLRRTCYGSTEGLMGKVFTRLVIAGGTCDADERVTNLLMVSGATIKQALQAAGFSRVQMHDNVFVARKV